MSCCVNGKTVLNHLECVCHAGKIDQNVVFEIAESIYQNINGADC